MKISEYFPREVFADRTVFVTGGGSGINLGIAKSYAAVGAKVAICGRTEEKLDHAKSELEALGVKTLQLWLMFEITMLCKILVIKYKCH